MEANTEVRRRPAYMGNGKPDMPLLKTKAEKAMRTTTDILVMSPDQFKEWKDPPFQRPLCRNAKVQAMVQKVKADGIIPYTLTVGIHAGIKYLLDGQHRREAYFIATKDGLGEVYAEVRYMYFDSMAQMGDEYANLNTALVKQRPDDILRAKEGSSEALQLIRQRCKFVGYDMIRRQEKSPILGMSAFLRCWYGSAAETPSHTAPTAREIADTFLIEDAALCCDFAILAERAWGREPEYKRLWASMNLTLCMWLYRRLIVNPDPTVTKLSKEQFRLCLTALSAAGDHIDWLVDRKMSDRDRGPCYNRIKKVFVSRLRAEGLRNAKLPLPAWAAQGLGGYSCPTSKRPFRPSVRSASR